MRENLIVSNRGQITLPASVRKRLGIGAGDILILEDLNGEIILRPAAVLAIEHYTDEQIAEWNDQDRLTPGEREKILRNLGKDR
jgi:AbrB family looped-hinge helix DNA binding protein